MNYYNKTKFLNRRITSSNVDTLNNLKTFIVKIY